MILATGSVSSCDRCLTPVPDVKDISPGFRSVTFLPQAMAGSLKASWSTAEGICDVDWLDRTLVHIIRQRRLKDAAKVATAVCRLPPKDETRILKSHCRRFLRGRLDPLELAADEREVLISRRKSLIRPKRRVSPP